MRYADHVELIEGRLVRRYKRFFADVALPGGAVVVTHCPNPGAMRACAPDDARVWIWRTEDPRRKLRYTWELVEAGGSLVCVNTARANALVAEALDAGAVEELVGYDQLAREVAPYEASRSRIDFLLTGDGARCWVEVKNVTMDVGDGVTAFPDSVTARGARHLEELIDLAATGDRAVLLFVSTRGDTRTITPADDIDPVYGATLRRAAAAGVELLAYRCTVSTDELALAAPVPLRL